MLLGLLMYIVAAVCGVWFFFLARSRERSGVLWALAAFALVFGTGAVTGLTASALLIPRLGQGPTLLHWLFLFALPPVVAMASAVLLRSRLLR